MVVCMCVWVKEEIERLTSIKEKVDTFKNKKRNQLSETYLREDITGGRTAGSWFYKGY